MPYFKLKFIILDVIIDKSSKTIKKLIPFSVLYITIKIEFDVRCGNYNELMNLNRPQNYSIGLGHNQILKKIYLHSNNFYKMMIQIIRQDRILPQLKDWLQVLSSMKLKRCALIQVRVLCTLYLVLYKIILIYHIFYVL